MPLLIIKTTVAVPESLKEELLLGATKIIVDAGKKESHVMVLLERVDACMGGKVGSAAFVEFRSMVGLTHEFNHKVSEGVCVLLEKTLGISGHHIYLNFISVPEGAWGWEHGIVIWNQAQKKWIIE
jgi:phenylpyruvate tautomerase PptA (4-oxalocrotonate tautomerase family)